MSTSIPHEDPHMMATSTEDFKNVELFSGDKEVVTQSYTVADAVIASADLPAYSVVGFDASNKLVKAITGSVDPDDDIKPIGITTATVKMGSTVKTVAVYRTGCFNPEALVWPTSYDTDAKKKHAFDHLGADILIRKPGYPLA